MIAELYKIWKDFWKWLHSLSKQAVMIVCTGVSIIACMGFVILTMMQIHQNDNNAPVLSEMKAKHAEVVYNDSIIMREIQNLTDLVTEIDNKVSKVILIVAANSNSDLIRRLVPYLENVATKQDTYSFVLDIQRELQRQPKDTVIVRPGKISVQKKPKY